VPILRRSQGLKQLAQQRLGALVDQQPEDRAAAAALLRFGHGLQRRKIVRGMRRGGSGRAPLEVVTKHRREEVKNPPEDVVDGAGRREERRVRDLALAAPLGLRLDEVCAAKEDHLATAEGHCVATTCRIILAHLHALSVELRAVLEPADQDALALELHIRVHRRPANTAEPARVEDATLKGEVGGEIREHLVLFEGVLLLLRVKRAVVSDEPTVLELLVWLALERHWLTRPQHGEHRRLLAARTARRTAPAWRHEDDFERA